MGRFLMACLHIIGYYFAGNIRLSFLWYVSAWGGRLVFNNSCFHFFVVGMYWGILASQGRVLAASVSRCYADGFVSSQYKHTGLHQFTIILFVGEYGEQVFYLFIYRHDKPVDFIRVLLWVEMDILSFSVVYAHRLSFVLSPGKYEHAMARYVQCSRTVQNKIQLSPRLRAARGVHVTEGSLASSMPYTTLTENIIPVSPMIRG